MSWVALCGVDDPPFKGSPDALACAASSMHTIAGKLQDQASLLQGYMDNTGSWTGIAKDACVKTVSGLPGQLRGAHDKYQNAANSLTPYATTLRDAQARAENLRSQAADEQWKIDHYSQGLKSQKQWEHAEKSRADQAIADPATYGSTTVRGWDGANNLALLDAARSQLAILRSQLAILRDDVQRSAANAAGGINAAADIVHDTGGLVGFFQHSAVNVQRAAKWLANEATAHGLDLGALSETLGDLSGWLSIVALLPIPGAQIFGLIGAAVGLVGLAASLVTVLAGQKSFKSWAGRAVSSMLPFASKGLKAISVARASGAAGEVSAVARNLIASEKGGSLIKNSAKLIDEAEKFKLGALQNKALKLLHIKPNLKPLQGLHLGKPGTTLLTGHAAANTATKIVIMSKSGVVGHIATGIDIVHKGEEAVDTGKKVVDLFGRLTDHKQHAGAGGW